MLATLTMLQVVAPATWISVAAASGGAALTLLLINYPTNEALPT